MSKPAFAKLSPAGQDLVDTCKALKQSGCIIEDKYWEKLIDQKIVQIFNANKGNQIDRALDFLATTDTETHDILLEHAETMSESCVLEKNGIHYDCLFIVVPIVAWTRFQIPSPAINPKTQDQLIGLLKKHISATSVDIAIHPHLCSVDQMPKSFSEVHEWCDSLARQALQLPHRELSCADMPEEDLPMLADTRYIMAVFCTPQNQRVFKWQEAEEKFAEQRALCLTPWQNDALPVFRELLPACGLELRLPDAFYIGNREADKRIRFAALTASVQWLQNTLDIPAEAFRATIAACGDSQIKEYRIGFTFLDSHQVIYGCLWPLFSDELDDTQDEPIAETEPLQHIIEQLQENGIKHIICINEMLKPGAHEESEEPLFPNPAGELSYVSAPDDFDDMDFSGEQFH
ncbi:MAG: DUF2863 family protein [Alcaligenaceae bacterium]|nr:DUF2863 family protein [Alcaligenaceae bacterium]